MNFIQVFLKKILSKFGYKLSKVNNLPLLDTNPFIAAKHEIKSVNPIVFDIGMNYGQTISKIRSSIPNAIIHGFEANKYCFKELESKFMSDKHVVMNDIAMGDEETTLEFNQYSWDPMSSFLQRAYGTSKIAETYDVNVTTVDVYCKKNSIDRIHVLKSDTEGFELKVLKGAQDMMTKNKIQFIYIELFFNLNFIGQASVGDIFSFLEDHNFSLVQFLEFDRTEKGLASRADALFINNNFEN